MFSKGRTSGSIVGMSENLILEYNKQSASLLRASNFQQAYNLLSKALRALKSSSDSISSQRLLSLTYSNFSVLYKETGRAQDSIKCLQKLIEIEKRLPGSKINTVNAYLNLCSLYSNSNDHESALRYGLTALILLQKEILLPEKYVESLVIAHHNVGVEYEYLNRIEDAVDCYKKGWELAKLRLGLNHPLTVSIKSSLVSTSTKPKFPEIHSNRTNSQHAYKRSDILDYSINTGSTSSSGVNDSRKIMTPRHVKGKRSIIKENAAKIRLRIDLQTQRNNEKNAAVLIQAWWRGMVQRKKFKEVKLKFQLKQAAIRAKMAFNEFKSIKEEVNKHLGDNFNRGNIEVLKGKPKNLVKIDIPAKKTAGPKELSQEALRISNFVNDKPVDIKSTNNQIKPTKSRNKARLSLSLQQFNKLYLPEIIKIQSFFRMVKTKLKYKSFQKSS